MKHVALLNIFKEVEEEVGLNKLLRLRIPFFNTVVLSFIFYCMFFFSWTFKIKSNSDILLCRIYLEHTDDVVKAVKEIVEEGIPEVGASKDGSSSSWPTLNKYNPLHLILASSPLLERDCGFFQLMFGGPDVVLCPPLGRPS